MSPATNWVNASPFDLTHWFSANKYNPGTPGVYERKMSATETHFSYWTGEFWCAWCYTVENACHIWLEKDQDYKSDYQNLPFRGLKHEPNK
jgi:hypothetical protein